MLKIGGGVLLAMGIAGPAYGQSVDSMTHIYGTIDEVCTVDTAESQVALDIANSASQQVTAVTYTCNTPGGFTRTISSENGGRLVRGSQGIPYTISHSGASGLDFGTANLNAPLTSTVRGSAEVAEGSTGVLRARIAMIPPNLLAGEYSDTVTIAITSN